MHKHKHFICVPWANFKIKYIFVVEQVSSCSKRHKKVAKDCNTLC